MEFSGSGLHSAGYSPCPIPPTTIRGLCFGQPSKVMRISNPLRPLPHRLHLFSRFNNTSNSHYLKSLQTNRNSSPSQGSPLSKAILAQKRSPSWDIPTNISLTKRFVGLCAFHFHLPPRIPLHGDSPLPPSSAKSPEAMKPLKALSGLRHLSATIMRLRST